MPIADWLLYPPLFYINIGFGLKEYIFKLYGHFIKRQKGRLQKDFEIKLCRDFSSWNLETWYRNNHSKKSFIFPKVWSNSGQ